MEQLTAAEAIRKRPGMYIGDCHDGSGLAHMVWEVVANSIDEHLAGACQRISVEIAEDGAVTVDDDGRGFPLQLPDGRRFAERALTQHHVTPTLDGHVPHAHVGIHGVGLFPICALSARLDVHVFRNGKHSSQSFAKGVATSDVQEHGKTERTGTRLTFLPDPTIFTGRPLQGAMVLERLTELSFLLPGLSIRFADSRVHTLEQPGGLAGHLEATARDTPIGSIFQLRELVEDIEIDIAARWGSFSDGDIHSFANTERTTHGGTHVRGLLSGLAEGLKRAAPALASYSAKQRERALSETLVALVCVRLNDPTYDAPTKTVLTTPRVQGIVKATVTRHFAEFLAREPQLLAHLRKRTARQNARRSSSNRPG